MLPLYADCVFPANMQALGFTVSFLLLTLWIIP